MIDQINELPEDGLKIHGLVEKLNKLYFLHLIDILNDLILCYVSVFSVNAPPHSKIRHSQLLFYRINNCGKTEKQGK